jgi:acetyl/propionyl-CoA carboxylase alpha subunit
MVTGLDLVAWQIKIAQGEALPASFERIEPRGHAVEVRLYAEDPYRGFAPSPGTIRALRLPEGPGVRNDCGVYGGSEVTVHYDPMLAKLICWGEDRAQALARLGRALEELRIEGIQTTVPLFRALLDDADFRAGRMDVAMLDRKLAAGELAPRPAGEAAAAAVDEATAAGAPAERGEAVNEAGNAPAADLDADLPFVAAALAHHHRASREAAGKADAVAHLRRRWSQAGRREALRVPR